jgi:hypothetical protein
MYKFFAHQKPGFFEKTRFLSLSKLTKIIYTYLTSILQTVLISPPSIPPQAGEAHMRHPFLISPRLRGDKGGLHENCPNYM